LSLKARNLMKTQLRNTERHIRKNVGIEESDENSTEEYRTSHSKKRKKSIHANLKKFKVIHF